MNLKNKKLLITTIIFFLIINTTYYWEGKFGFFAFPAFFILMFVYFGLAIVFIVQIYFAVEEKLTNKPRLLTIGLLTIVLVLTFFKPYGLVDFDKLQGDDILIAGREGVASCMTTLKLKDNFTFRETNICFGVTEVKGKFHLQNDTIYFDNVNIGRHKKEFYEFAIVKPSRFNQDGKHFDLIRYKNLTDTIGDGLWITKNELYKLKNKKPNR
jgi:hypothetical protein